MALLSVVELSFAPQPPVLIVGWVGLGPAPHELGFAGDLGDLGIWLLASAPQPIDGALLRSGDFPWLLLAPQDGASLVFDCDLALGLGAVKEFVLGTETVGWPQPETASVVFVVFPQLGVVSVVSVFVWPQLGAGASKVVVLVFVLLLFPPNRSPRFSPRPRSAKSRPQPRNPPSFDSPPLPR